jgi:hypothetical protein
MIDLLASLLPQIIIGLLVLAAVLFLISLQQLRRGRTGPYWRLRRTAGQRGGQLFLASIALFGIAFALALFSGLADLAYTRLRTMLNTDPDAPKGVALPTLTPTLRFTWTPTPSPTPTATHTPTDVPDTETPVPSPTPTETTTPRPSLTPSPTLTPSATFETVLAITPPASRVTPRQGAAINITAASSGLDSDGAVNPTTTFPAGTPRIYLTFTYRQMNDGITWTRILYRDGIQIQGGSYIWSLGENGESFFFFGSETGYPPGEYKIRLYLGEEEVEAFDFTVTPE